MLSDELARRAVGIDVLLGLALDGVEISAGGYSRVAATFTVESGMTTATGTFGPLTERIDADQVLVFHDGDRQSQPIVPGGGVQSLLPGVILTIHAVLVPMVGQ